MKSIISIAVLCLTFAGRAATNDAFNIKGCTWGMTKEQVKQIMKVAPSEEQADGMLYPDNQLGDMKYAAIFDFDVNKGFNKCIYVFDTRLINGACVDDFERLKELLTKKYGASFRDKTIWWNYHFKNDREKWGLAIVAGHLGFHAEWSLADTEILLMLSSTRDGEAMMVIKYASRALKEEADAISEEELLKEL